MIYWSEVCSVLVLTASKMKVLEIAAIIMEEWNWNLLLQNVSIKLLHNNAGI